LINSLQLFKHKTQKFKNTIIIVLCREASTTFSSKIQETARPQALWPLGHYTLAHWAADIPGVMRLWPRQVGIWHLAFGHFPSLSLQRSAHLPNSFWDQDLEEQGYATG
jgi:hypothetical protein